ncbi:50S ribosomal protein L4 [bacterium]|nr:50S ribosomal protein L4 [bacterium]|tara:strand:+ start:495 stop:1106 length:612 start_codon:yes stop_codon:yes gene_type:complete
MSVSINILNFSGDAVGQESVAFPLSDHHANEHLVYLMYQHQRKRERSGTGTFKSRKDVRGGGKKMYRQKGTGRARKGGSRSPLMVGGGKAFGRVTRDMSTDLPKKVAKLGVVSALAMNASKLVVLDAPSPEAMKAKEWRGLFGAGNVRFLCLVDDVDRPLSFFNYPNVDVCLITDIPLESILRADSIVVFRDQLVKFQELYCV